jgi:hypothetical protein
MNNQLQSLDLVKASILDTCVSFDLKPLAAIIILVAKGRHAVSADRGVDAGRHRLSSLAANAISHAPPDWTLWPCKRSAHNRAARDIVTTKADFQCLHPGSLGM